LSAYKEYLQFISADKETEPEHETTESINAEKAGATELDSDAEMMRVSFTDTRHYSYTNPSDLDYKGKHYHVKNWTQAYVQLVKCLFEDYSDTIASLQGKSIRGKGRIDIADTSGSDAMIAPREISEDLYLETDETVGTIVEKSGLFLKLCNVDYDDVKISYVQSTAGKNKQGPVSNKTNQEALNNPQSGQSFYDWLVKTKGKSEKTGRSYDSAINTADAYAREHNIGHGIIRGTTEIDVVSETVDALFQTVEFVEQNKRQHSRLRAALQKYLEYLGNGGNVVVEKHPAADLKESFNDVDFEPYREILSARFPKGFRVESRLDMGRFRAFWTDKYGSELKKDR